MTKKSKNSILLTTATCFSLLILSCASDNNSNFDASRVIAPTIETKKVNMDQKYFAAEITNAYQQNRKLSYIFDCTIGNETIIPYTNHMLDLFGVDNTQNAVKCNIFFTDNPERKTSYTFSQGKNVSKINISVYEKGVSKDQINLSLKDQKRDFLVKAKAAGKTEVTGKTLFYTDGLEFVDYKMEPSIELTNEQGVDTVFQSSNINGFSLYGKNIKNEDINKYGVIKFLSSTNNDLIHEVRVYLKK